MEQIAEFRRLKNEIERKEHVEKKYAALKQRESELVSQLGELRTALAYEREDVEKLEKMSILSLWYSLTGTKVEKLDKEKKEAAAAEMNYLLVEGELKTVSAEAEKTEKELKYLTRCEEKCEELRKEITSINLSLDAGISAFIFEKLNAYAKYEARLKEVREAIDVGNKIESATGTALEYISKYKASLRRNSNNMLLSEEVELYEGLKVADNLLVNIRGLITCFNAELSDVTDEWHIDGIREDVHVVSYSNYFTESVIYAFDVKVLPGAVTELRKVRSDVGEVLYLLNKKRERLEKLIGDLEKDIDTEIVAE